MPFLAAVKEAKFRSFVQPGKTLTAEAKISHDGSGYAMMEASISCDGQHVCNAAITFHVHDSPIPNSQAEMRRRAAAIGLPSKEALVNG